jgi:hypothetical protein
VKSIAVILPIAARIPGLLKATAAPLNSRIKEFQAGIKKFVINANGFLIISDRIEKMAPGPPFVVCRFKNGK